MVDKRPDIGSILEELKRVLEGLSGEEKRQVQEKIEKKIEQTEVTQQSRVGGITGMPQKPPTILPPVVPERVTQEKPEEPPVIPEQVLKLLPKEEIKPEKVIPKQPEVSSIKREVTFSSTKLVEEVPKVIPKTQPPEILPEPILTEETPEIELPVEEKLPSEEVLQVPPEKILKIGCIYPIEVPNARETFLTNLVDVVQKTTKKPFYPKIVYSRGVDFFRINLIDLVEQCKSTDIEVVCIIHPDLVDPSPIVNKLALAGIISYTIPVTQLTKKMVYIDIVIDLMLTKKK